MYPTYYLKEKTMIGSAHLFHASHTDNNHPFFAGIVHMKAVEVQNYDPLTEKDLIGKIVNILFPSDKSVEYIKQQFPEYFNSHLEHIGLYGNYCRTKKTFDTKFRAHMNTYNSIISFSPNELNLLLSSYEKRLQNKRENSKPKHYYNPDLTLEDTADLIEQKKKEDLDAIIDTIKDKIRSNDSGLKKFKRDTSDDDSEDENEKKNEAVTQKLNQYIECYSLVHYTPTHVMPENFISADFDPEDCTVADIEPQNMIAPEGSQFDYTTEDLFSDYLQPPVLPIVNTNPSASMTTKRVVNFDDK
jgi:hypothetical protein